MLVYFRGASIALALASISYYLFLVSLTGIWTGFDNSLSQEIFLVILTGLTYAFCILGYVLFKFLKRNKIYNPVICLILFALLGELTAWLLYFIVPLDWQFHLITVAGAVVFGLTTYMRSTKALNTLVVAGPLITLIIGLLV